MSDERHRAEEMFTFLFEDRHISALTGHCSNTRNKTAERLIDYIAAKLAALEGDPSEGLEDAVREGEYAWLAMHRCEPDEDDHIKIAVNEQYIKHMVAAVQPGYDILRAETATQHRKIGGLQADNDALKKQVEELEEEREGAYKHGYEDAGGSR